MFWHCQSSGEGSKPLDGVKGQNPAFPTLTKDRKATKDSSTWAEVKSLTLILEGNWSSE